MGYIYVKKTGVIAVAVLALVLIVIAVSVKTGVFAKDKPVDGKYYFV